MAAAQCSECTGVRERDLTTEQRLTRIEAKLDALTDRIDDAIVTQVKDHGKRLTNLERRAMWAAGWTAGAACAASGLTQMNAANAQAEGKEAKQTGEENAALKRQEAAKLIGRQRAAAGASGATVQSGSFMDVYMDTAERGEIDAMALAEEGRRVDYNKRVEAWNYQQQAAGHAEQANAAQQNVGYINPWLGAAGNLLSGAAQAGSNFHKMSK